MTLSRQTSGIKSYLACVRFEVSTTLKQKQNANTLANIFVKIKFHYRQSDYFTAITTTHVCTC